MGPQQAGVPSSLNINHVHNCRNVLHHTTHFVRAHESPNAAVRTSNHIPDHRRVPQRIESLTIKDGMILIVHSTHQSSSVPLTAPSAQPVSPRHLGVSTPAQIAAQTMRTQPETQHIDHLSVLSNWRPQVGWQRGLLHPEPGMIGSMNSTNTRAISISKGAHTNIRNVTAPLPSLPLVSRLQNQQNRGSIQLNSTTNCIHPCHFLTSLAHQTGDGTQASSKLSRPALITPGTKTLLGGKPCVCLHHICRIPTRRAYSFHRGGQVARLDRVLLPPSLVPYSASAGFACSSHGEHHAAVVSLLSATPVHRRGPGRRAIASSLPFSTDAVQSELAGWAARAVEYGCTLDDAAVLDWWPGVQRKL